MFGETIQIGQVTLLRHPVTKGLVSASPDTSVFLSAFQTLVFVSAIPGQSCHAEAVSTGEGRTQLSHFMNSARVNQTKPKRTARFQTYHFPESY